MKSWKYTTYQQTGKQQEVCRNFVTVREDDRHLIACLCGGLEPKYADYAAEIACDTVAKLFTATDSPKGIVQNDRQQVKDAMIGAIQNRLNQVAADQEAKPSVMDCTAVFVCVFKKSDVAVAGILGDGALCVIGGKAAKLIRNAAYVPGEGGLQTETAAQRLDLHVLKLDKVEGFVLASYGMEGEVFYDGEDYVAKGTELYFNAVLSADPQAVIRERLEALAAQPDSAYTGDCSVAVVSSAEAAVAVPDEPAWPCLCGNNNPLYEPACTKCAREFDTVYKNVVFEGGETKFFRNWMRNPEKKKTVIAAFTALKQEEEAAEKAKAAEAEAAAKAAQKEPDEWQPVEGEREPEQKPQGKLAQLKSVWLYLLIAFLIGALVGGIVMSIVGAANKGKTTAAQTTAPAQVTQPATAAPVATIPMTTVKPTAAANAADVIGTWTLTQYTENGVDVPLQGQSFDAYTFIFEDGGKVTRVSSFGQSETGYYETGANGVTVGFSGTSYQFALNADKKSFNVEIDGQNGAKGTALYEKVIDVTQETQPADDEADEDEEEEIDSTQPEETVAEYQY